MQYMHIHDSTLPHLRCSPGESSNAVQRRQELLLHDLGQAHICNLGCEISRQQNVGRLEIKVHNLPRVQKVQASRCIQGYPPPQPWAFGTSRRIPASSQQPVITPQFAKEAK